MRSAGSPDSEPPRRRRRGWLGLAIGSLLAACAPFPPLGLKAPKLMFKGIVLRDLTREGARFDLAVQADNPNAVEVPVTGLRFSLALVGQEVAQGKAAEATVVLPAQARRLIVLECVAPLRDLREAARRMPGQLNAGVDYQLKGSASWGDSTLAIPFERTGRFELPRALRLLLGPAVSDRVPGARIQRTS